MKVAMFTETFLPQANGVVTSVCSFTEELLNQGHQVEIFAPAPGEEDYDGVPVHRFKSFTFKPYPEFRATLPPVNINKFVKNKNFDIVHTHGPFALGWAGWATAKRNHLPCISTFHTPISDYVPYLFKGKHLVLLGKKLAWTYSVKHYNAYHYIITPSEIIKELLRGKGVKRPIAVIPTGIRLEEFASTRDTAYVRQKFGLGRFIFHAGRLSREKNVDTVIKALPLILERFPEIKLVIASKGPAIKELQALTKKMGLEDKVVFTGYVDQEDLIALYREAEITVIASGAETQGLVITEAMACETPVVGAEALAIPEVIDGTNGFLFKLRDHRDLAAKAIAILSDGALRQAMGKKALETAMENTVEERTRQLVALYETLAKGLKS